MCTCTITVIVSHNQTLKLAGRAGAWDSLAMPEIHVHVVICTATTTHAIYIPTTLISLNTFRVPRRSKGGNLGTRLIQSEFKVFKLNMIVCDVKCRVHS